MGQAEQERRRADRYELRRGLWQVSKLDRVRACGRWRINGDQGVPVIVQDGDDGDRAHYANLQQCASVWACPVCSAKIRNRRAGEIELALRSHLGAGGRAFLVTLTVPHDRGDRLDSLLDTVARGWSRVISGRAWAGYTRSDGTRVLGDRDACGVIGTIRSLEVTVGPNGWHPHLHVLVLVDGDGHGSSGRAAALRRHGRLFAGIRSRWETWTIEQGLRRPSQSHGVRIDEVRTSDVGAYVGKVQEGWASLELARGDLKEGRRSGRTPLAVLRDAMATGDVADVRLWHEYERVTRGRQAISWSAGLHARFDVEEVTDEEAAALDVGGEPVCVIPPSTWRGLCSTSGGLVVVLEAAERDGVSGVAAALRALGLPDVLWRPPPRPVEVAARSG